MKYFFCAGVGVFGYIFIGEKIGIGKKRGLALGLTSPSGVYEKSQVHKTWL